MIPRLMRTGPTEARRVVVILSSVGIFCGFPMTTRISSHFYARVWNYALALFLGRDERELAEHSLPQFATLARFRQRFLMLDEPGRVDLQKALLCFQKQQDIARHRNLLPQAPWGTKLSRQETFDFCSQTVLQWA
jgi:hypothetical protein